MSLAVPALHRDFVDYVAARAAHKPPSPSRCRLPRLARLVSWEWALRARRLERTAAYDFRLRGWTRSGPHRDGVESCADADQLRPFLEGCDVLVGAFYR